MSNSIGRDDGGGSSAAANYDAARQEIAKRSRSSQPNGPGRISTSANANYLNALKTLDTVGTPEHLNQPFGGNSVQADNKHILDDFNLMPSGGANSQDLIEMDQR